MTYRWTVTILLVMLGMLNARAAEAQEKPDLIVHNAKIVTMDDGKPRASAIAVHDGRFTMVGDNDAILASRGETTRVIDAGGRTIIPGLTDSHLHATRGGRYFNLETRWDGVKSLRRGLEMISEQAQRTPDGQWVRVIGGWSPFQFEERRMPTVQELNEAAPETPVFILFLYSRGFVNHAGVKALGIDENTVPPSGARYEFVDGGAVLHAEPNPTILYQAIGQLPGLSPLDQANSTRHFYRELNRFGLTGAIDAGGGGHHFPDDYGGSQALVGAGVMPLRLSYYLFPQRPRQEYEDFIGWTNAYQAGHNEDPAHDHGFELEGGGEFLVWSAGDFENFMADRPDLDERGNWRDELHRVATLLVERSWPLRIHATYGESIAQIMDVFERIKHEQGRFAPRWAIDHAETAQEAQLRRVKALGGGIAIQNRMSFAGEYFVERYGPQAALYAPPVRMMLNMGIPVGGGTDATRVSSHNPWLSIHWLVSGKTLGGMELFAADNRLTREEALQVWTIGSAWFSQEEDVKGRIKPGQFADFALLDRDYLSVAEDEIASIESVLTIVAGEVVYSATPFDRTTPGPSLPPVSPQWSPVAHFGGYQR